MIEIEDALRTEVPGVCRLYCAQVWDEALNQAGVEVSFVLRRAESVYYPPAIRASSSSNAKLDVPFEGAELQKSSPSKVPIFWQPSKNSQVAWGE